MRDTPHEAREATDAARPGLIARLGLSCVAAALVTGIGGGLWELARPILSDAETFAAASRAHLVAYAALQVFKTVGFLAGLYGFYLCATRRGPVVKVFMALAVAGGLFFSAAWLWLAISARFSFIYVLGGMWYQMIAPVALGVAAFFARRAARWKALVFVVVGVLNAQIFPLLGPAWASIVQGLIWAALGVVVYTCQRAARDSSNA